MVKTNSVLRQRNFGVVYADFLLTDESIRFIGGQIDVLCEEFDRLIEGPRSERLEQVCGQIATLYKKSLFEARKLTELGGELAGLGVPKRFFKDHAKR